jgi:hypothetical protein
MRRDIDAFERNWVKNARRKPDDYPFEMGPIDWFAQFLFFKERA